MNIQTSSCMTSSLNAAAFRTILARDGRGLVYRLRREIMTLRRLRQDPYPAVLTFALRGRPHSSQDVKTMTSKVINGKVRP